MSSIELLYDHIKGHLTLLFNYLQPHMKLSQEYDLLNMYFNKESIQLGTLFEELPSEPRFQHARELFFNIKNKLIPLNHLC